MTDTETMRDLARAALAAAKGIQHDGHEATCLCCKKVQTGAYADPHTNRPYGSADCRAKHFWGAEPFLWHNVFIRARHCPDFEERE